MRFALAGDSSWCSPEATRRVAPTNCYAAQADWSAWHVYFGDERCTAHDDPLRNSRMAESAWLEHVPIPRRQVHEIPAELGPNEAAKRYASVLEPVGEFDLVLFGLGEDGLGRRFLEVGRISRLQFRECDWRISP